MHAARHSEEENHTRDVRHERTGYIPPHWQFHAHGRNAGAIAREEGRAAPTLTNQDPAARVTTIATQGPLGPRVSKVEQRSKSRANAKRAVRQNKRARERYSLRGGVRRPAWPGSLKLENFFLMMIG